MIVRKISVILGTLAVILIGIADFAVPGEPLHILKTHVNEPVRGMLVRTPSAKAAWNVEQLNRTLSEAEQLAHRRKLEPRVTQQLASAIQSRTQNVMNVIADLSEHGNENIAAQTSAELEATLKAHANIMLALHQAVISNHEAVKATSQFAKQVAQETKRATELRIQLETNLTSEPRPNLVTAIQERRELAESNLQTAARSYQQNTTEAMDQHPVAFDAVRKIRHAELSFAEAEINAVHEDFSAALLRYSDAARLSAEAISIFKTIERVPEVQSAAITLTGSTPSEASLPDLSALEARSLLAEAERIASADTVSLEYEPEPIATSAATSTDSVAITTSTTPTSSTSSLPLASSPQPTTSPTATKP